MIKGKTVTKIDAYELFDVMLHHYNIDREDAQLLLFGEGAESGSVRNATAEVKFDFDAGFTSLTEDDVVYPRKPGGRRVTASDVLTDLCSRGEVAPGEYVIELSW